VKQVGQGAFGAVYRATGQTSQEVYAIKVTRRKTHEHDVLRKTDGERLVNLLIPFQFLSFLHSAASRHRPTKLGLLDPLMARRYGSLPSLGL